VVGVNLTGFFWLTRGQQFQGLVERAGLQVGLRRGQRALEGGQRKSLAGALVRGTGGRGGLKAQTADAWLLDSSPDEDWAAGWRSRLLSQYCSTYCNTAAGDFGVASPRPSSRPGWASPPRTVNRR
jgi:hypothetical protein